MGILSKYKLIPKKHSETKHIDTICVSTAEAWFAKIQYGNYRPFTVRFDVAIGGRVQDEIVDGIKAFLREGENVTVHYETHIIPCAIITFDDATQETRDLSPCDQDLPVRASLEPELCRTYYKEFHGYGKDVYYQNVKELHYAGLNYVDDWTEVANIDCKDYYSASTIQSICIVPGEDGWEALITFIDKRQISLCVDERSRVLTNGETLSLDRCTIIKKRLYHTIEKDFILVL